MRCVRAALLAIHVASCAALVTAAAEQGRMLARKPSVVASSLVPTCRAALARQPRAAVVVSVLTSEQRDVLIEASQCTPFCSAGATPLTQANATTWQEFKTRWPALAEATDSELAQAYSEYLKEPPNLLEVLVKTPLGPFLLLWGVPWDKLLGDQQQLLGGDLGWSPFGGS